ncbi:efflux RND transporter permease subunit [Oricola cellulosilytica]|uniref:Efflux RND transporter permease subunit n=1 Tax=Oricola cellulosilytica TaxID=1429082 RepID=A0A4V2MP15_9HYPH|nr:efflux RND transporter permease subunit [Oricola cellulosilytica]TCD15962.1 efflux RND transporter permease subunit [Oricola cellulosilytica]
MSFLDVAVKNARLTVTALLFFLVAGAVAYVNIPKEAEPDIQFPVIYVSLSLQGISPEDSERLLVRPVETQVKSIKGIDKITSSAYQGGGNVLIEFDPDSDLSTALEDVRSKVSDAKRQFPAGADEPTVNEVNISEFPVLVVTLSGNAPERLLTRTAKDLRDRIEEVTGVLEGKLQGSRDEMVEVIIDPVKLSSYDLQLDALIGGVVANNQLVAAGTLEGSEGKYAVKVPALIETVEDVANLPIAASGNAVVRARDLALIRSTFEDAESIARLNGNPAIAIEVSKRAGANLIETVDAVKATAEAFKPFLPAGVEVSYSQDKSTDIRNMLDDLQNSVLTAVILVFIVILFFLGFRSSILIGMSIPTAFLIGILGISLAGLTVNIVVLFSLILAVGMLVDDAIIVTEYAERRMSEGMKAGPAFSEAARRMFGPVVVSTLTRIAAFSPLLFWPGIVGEFMRYLPITLIATLTASMVYALLFAPTLGSIFGKAHVEERQPDGPYMMLVGRAVRHPFVTMGFVMTLMAAVIFAFASNNKGVEFFPNVEPEYGLVYVHARGNLSLEEQDEAVRLVERKMLQWPGVETVYSRVGRTLGGGGGFGGSVDEDVIGTIQYEFVDWRERKPASEILTDLRGALAGLPGIEAEVSVPDAGPPQGKPIQVELSADDPSGLDDAAKQVANYLASIPEVIDLSDGLPPPSIDWELRVDRTEAAKYGIGPNSVGTVVQLVTTGLKLSDYRPAGADDAVDIRLRLPENRRTLSTLDQLRIETPQGAVPLANFVSREPARSLGTLTRLDGTRTITVSANLVEGSQDSVFQAKVADAIPTLDLPENVRWKLAGSNEESAEASAFLSQAFGVAIFLIFALLLAQFNRFTYVWLVLTAVVMSTVGVLLGLLVMQMPFSIVMTAVGTIALAGVVVNNNIVLIDTYAHLRNEGWDKLEAVLETCRERVRPVMLTAVTAILGVLPIAFGVNLALLGHEVTIGAPSTQWWIALSSAIVFGLAFSTLLTLVVTPAALMVFTRDNEWMADERPLLTKLIGRRTKVVKKSTSPAKGEPQTGVASPRPPQVEDPFEDYPEYPKAAE